MREEDESLLVVALQGPDWCAQVLHRGAVHNHACAICSKAFTVIDDVEGASSLTRGFGVVAMLCLALVVDRINL